MFVRPCRVLVGTDQTVLNPSGSWKQLLVACQERWYIDPEGGMPEKKSHSNSSCTGCLR